MPATETHHLAQGRSDEELESLKEALAAAEALAEEYQNHHLRAAAELENYRKRVAAIEIENLKTRFLRAKSRDDKIRKAFDERKRGPRLARAHRVV